MLKLNKYLSNTPSVLIDAAVDDLEIIELDEKYIVNMDEYYRHGGGNHPLDTRWSGCGQ